MPKIKRVDLDDALSDMVKTIDDCERLENGFVLMHDDKLDDFMQKERKMTMKDAKEIARNIRIRTEDIYNRIENL